MGKLICPRKTPRPPSLGKGTLAPEGAAPVHEEHETAWRPLEFGKPEEDGTMGKVSRVEAILRLRLFQHIALRYRVQGMCEDRDLEALALGIQALEYLEEHKLQLMET